MKNNNVFSLISVWFFMAVMFGSSMYFTSLRDDEPFSIVIAMVSGVVFATLMVCSMTIINSVKSKKLKKLFDKYGMTNEFVDKCDEMMKKEKNGQEKTRIAIFLADKYFQRGDIKSALNVLKTNTVPGALSPMTEITLYNNFMFYSLMDNDLNSAEQFYPLITSLLTKMNITPDKLPAAVADTFAVREYMHGNYQGSLRLLELIPKESGTASNDYRELHTAWNYLRMGRADEAREMLGRLSKSAIEEFVRNQAYGLLSELKSAM